MNSLISVFLYWAFFSSKFWIFLKFSSQTNTFEEKICLYHYWLYVNHDVLAGWLVKNEYKNFCHFYICLHCICLFEDKIYILLKYRLKTVIRVYCDQSIFMPYGFILELKYKILKNLYTEKLKIERVTLLNSSMVIYRFCKAATDAGITC